MGNTNFAPFFVLPIIYHCFFVNLLFIFSICNIFDYLKRINKFVEYYDKFILYNWGAVLCYANVVISVHAVGVQRAKVHCTVRKLLELTSQKSLASAI